MIRARLSDGRFVVGIDAENVRRLTAGKPIVIDLAAIGGTDRLMILYGPTMQAIVQELEEASGQKLPVAMPEPPGTKQ